MVNRLEFIGETLMLGKDCEIIEQTLGKPWEEVDFTQHLTNTLKVK